jgi:AraC-like DNA-binding protein
MADFGALTLDEFAGGGRLDGGNSIVEIQPGFFLGRTDLPLDGEMAHEAESFPFVALGILLEGHIRTDVRGMEHMDPNGLLVTSHNEYRTLASRFSGGPRLRNVEIFLTPDWFERPGNRLADDPTFEEMRLAMDRPLRHRRRPLDAHFRDIAQAVLESGEGGAVAALRLEARALDLLAALGSSFRDPGRQTSLSVRDRDRMFSIRQVIERDPGSVGSLTTLAAQHGVSASKLKRDFFIAFSTCVGGFVNEQRLALGRRLLEEGMTVSQAAYRVGYAHPTNFATAFRKRYGVAPRSVRN